MGQELKSSGKIMVERLTQENNTLLRTLELVMQRISESTYSVDEFLNTGYDSRLGVFLSQDDIRTIKEAVEGYAGQGF